VIEDFVLQPTDENWCDVCHNSGVVPCLCGGDTCVCGMEEHDCQHCDREIEPPEDEWPDEDDDEPSEAA
jgi:RecJ-like exonuclease